MCNRYRITAGQAEIAARYGVALPYPADPVLLHAEGEARWLACGFEEAVSLAVAFPSQLMRVGGENLAAPWRSKRASVSNWP